MSQLFVFDDGSDPTIMLGDNYEVWSVDDQFRDTIDSIDALQTAADGGFARKVIRVEGGDVTYRVGGVTTRSANRVLDRLPQNR